MGIVGKLALVTAEIYAFSLVAGISLYDREAQLVAAHGPNVTNVD
jgi:hypothetical protein